MLHLTDIVGPLKERAPRAPKPAPAAAETAAVPAEEKSILEKRQEKKAAEKAEREKGPDEEGLKKLQEITDEATVKACVELLKSDGSEKVKTPKIENKEVRTSLHGLVRTTFGGRLLTSTDVASGTIVISLGNAATKSADGERRRSKRGGKNHPNEWATLGGDYCHFTLYKENKDTMEVVGLLGRLMRLNNANKIFGFAGTKDRRAVTVQRCSAYRIKAERLAGLNKGGDFGLRGGVKVGNFTYEKEGLRLGDLAGNEFNITLRECRVDDAGVGLREVVEKAVERVKQTGFANYFGLQRFGTYESASTADIGRLLLRGEYRAAVEALLAYDPAVLSTPPPADIAADDIARAAACHTFATTNNWDEASRAMPRKFTAEAGLLRGIAQRGIMDREKLDWLGAIQAIPRGLRTMYVHAYQSLIFNNVLSARLRLSRDSVLPGDLVIVDKADKPATPAAPAEPEYDQDGGLVVAPTLEADPKEDMFERARALSAEEAASGKYTIFDVVLPTPGWDVVYPENEELWGVFREIMGKDGLDPKIMRRSVKDFSLPGSYRKIVAGFVDGVCEVRVESVEKGGQVVETDLERIEKAKAEEEKAEKVESEEVVGEKRKREEEEGEKETVVVLKMRLGTSTYATMALRELMKGGTVAYQPEFGRPGAATSKAEEKAEEDVKME